MFNSCSSFIIKLVLIFGYTSAIPDNPRKGRLLGATLITRNQINDNFQASGSIAIAYSTVAAWAGVILAKDTFVTTQYLGEFRYVYVSELTARHKSAGQAIKDSGGEKHTVTARPAVYGPHLSALTVTQFSPLPKNSKAVVATLPPNGSKPPPPGTTGCVVYGFGENKQTDGSDPSTNRLGFLPLIVKRFEDCKDKYLHPGSPEDRNLQFCGALDSAIQPYCSDHGDLDYPLIAACPAGTLRKEYRKEGKFINELEQVGDDKKLCPFWWWWWCQDQQDSVVKDPWIIVGISKTTSVPHNCSPPTANDALFIFSFMGNL